MSAHWKKVHGLQNKKREVQYGNAYMFVFRRSNIVSSLIVKLNIPNHFTLFENSSLVSFSHFASISEYNNICYIIFDQGEN